MSREVTVSEAVTVSVVLQWKIHDRQTGRLTIVRKWCVWRVRVLFCVLLAELDSWGPYPLETSLQHNDLQLRACMQLWMTKGAWGCGKKGMTVFKYKTFRFQILFEILSSFMSFRENICRFMLKIRATEWQFCESFNSWPLFTTISQILNPCSMDSITVPNLWTLTIKVDNKTLLNSAFAEIYFLFLE